ncbi:MAG TPA: hypothetical protein VGB85_16645 [Nannocystis sp.]
MSPVVLLWVSLGTGSVQAPDGPPTAAQDSAAPASMPSPPAPAPAPAASPGVVAVAYTPYQPQPQRAVPPRRFVVAFLPSLTMGISPRPSFNLAGFVGGRLPGAWALGYQFAFSSGFAERYSRGLLTHRHHVMAMRAFGASGRGFASVGAGAAFLELNPVVEAEGRLGVRFGRKKYGVVAAMMRLGWDIGHRERVPMPQFGIVFGFAVM